MKNEIGRKITSLTIMTIMIAGGMTFAVPGMVPAAYAANANLFVSAENSQFDNYMSGPNVIEVVIIDSDINDTDEAKGEPDVTVNGKILRMTQAVDGNWYGYFSDRDQAIIADATTDEAGIGLDFGEICSTATAATSISDPFESGFFSDAQGVAINASTCGGSVFDATDINVLREAKQLNLNIVPFGQIGVETDSWPFIQLYTLSVGGNVVVQYNKGGGAQTTTLTFDTVEAFAGIELDRSIYPQGSEVHATITDLWLNVDPTDEDSWTFGAGNPSTHYQVFDENGGNAGDTDSNTDDDLTDALGDLLCEDNCLLLINPDVQGKGDVITLQDNDDSEIAPTGGDPQESASWGTTLSANLDGALPVTFTEIGPNTGVFGSYDESDVSNLIITTDAARGTSASIDYNEVPVTILVGHGFASISMITPDDEWNSGEELTIQLVDSDANRNSRADEDLDLFDPNVALIPALRTGDPFTLAENEAEQLDYDSLAGIWIASEGSNVPADILVQAFSKRGIVTESGVTLSEGASGLVIDLEASGADLHETVFDNQIGVIDTVFNLVNQDFRSLASGDDVEVFIIFTDDPATTCIDTDGISLVDIDTVELDGTNAQDYFDITGTTDLGDLLAIPDDSAICLEILFDTVLDPIDRHPIAFDFFSYGFIDDGVQAAERVSNQIIRAELEETGDNTSTFEGTLEFVMVNQLNIQDPGTFTSRFTIDNYPTFVVIEDLTDEDSPRFNYLDLGADGVSTQISDQEEAPSHSGIVSFDSDSYKIADTVTVTIEDLDLNADSFLIDIYTVVSLDGDIAFDAVGAPGLPELSFGPLGRLADITFDDQLWTSAHPDCIVASGGNDGLGSTGFTFVETSKDSGIFVADFQVPADWCRSGATLSESSTGLDLEVNYVDFRDASGEIIEVGDSAGIRANTGSVSLDRTVYPVPFGVSGNFDDVDGDTSPDNRSIFAIHATGVDDLSENGQFLPNGDLIIHVRVNDPDFDISASGEDVINANKADEAVGPVEISVIRGSNAVVLGHAGGPSATDGRINVGTNLLGDTEIQTSEIICGVGFLDDTENPVTITQAGAEEATGLFSDLNDGEVEPDELDPSPASPNAQVQDGITIVLIGAPGAATATFVDDGDGVIEEGELVDITTTTDFTTPQAGILMEGTAGEPHGTTDFLDAPRVDADELAITDGGFGFEDGEVTLTDDDDNAITCDFEDAPDVRQFGPILEIAPDAGIFEIDIVIQYTDGPSSTICPETDDFDATSDGVQTESDRFNTPAPTDQNYCILQGDILQIEYTDPADASGDPNTVTDSATFDLRNGVLQSDKSVYIIGSDMILTLIEPDFDLDNDSAETYDLDLIEWDSDAATVTMGDASDIPGEDKVSAAFDPEPTDFRETGDSTGIFQIVIEIPEVLENDRLERGEEIILEYTDWGPSGSDFVGDEDEDVNLTIYTSNFGATVELDQKVYTWTDKIYVTIVAPDHNFDSDLVDEIGETDLDPIKVATRGDDIDNYKLVETGTDTGIFTGEVILTGFTHDADGDSRTGDQFGNDVISRAPTGVGPTDGFLPADDDDGITVSFEFSEDETVVGSALIRWNIGEVQWLEASYPASGTGVVRVIDPDMNLNPEAVNNFNVDIWSDSDAGGIDLTVTETN